MAIKKYGFGKDIALSPSSKLLLWTIENPEKAIEIGTAIAIAGGLICFLGALFSSK